MEKGKLKMGRRKEIRADWVEQGLQEQSLDNQFTEAPAKTPVGGASRGAGRMGEMATGEAPPRFAGSATVTVKSSFAPRATRLV